MESEIQKYLKPQKSDEGSWLKEMNLVKLGKYSRYTHSLVKDGDVAVFRIPGRFTVDFFTRKNRWKVRGNKKTTYGTIEEFFGWLNLE